MFWAWTRRRPGVAPERNDTRAASVFFLAWMIVGSFISLNLFVGAIVDNFTKIKQQSDGLGDYDARAAAVGGCTEADQPEPAGEGARAAHVAAAAQGLPARAVAAFEYVVMTVIVLNVLGMALDHYGTPRTSPSSTSTTHGMLFFTYFYYCEALLKIFALGTNYFADGWCRFDFFLVVVSLMDQFFLELLLEILPMPPTVLRVLRVARVLRILRLLEPQGAARPGRDARARLPVAHQRRLPARHRHVHVRRARAEPLHLRDARRRPRRRPQLRELRQRHAAPLPVPHRRRLERAHGRRDVDEARGCDPARVPSNCGTPLALPYFISFTVLGSFVFLNLVVAVILEHFTALGNVNPNSSPPPTSPTSRRRGAASTPTPTAASLPRSCPRLSTSCRRRLASRAPIRATSARSA